MAEVFVSCPDCGYRARLSHDREHHIVDVAGRCKHSWSAENCPVLQPALLAARETLEELGG